MLAETAALRADIWQDIESFLGSLWSAVAGFFGGIFGAIENAIIAVFDAPIKAVQSSWADFTSWVAGYGPLAPILTILVIGGFLAIAVFFIWLLVKFSVSQTEQVGEEAEEGV